MSPTLDYEPKPPPPGRELNGWALGLASVAAGTGLLAFAAGESEGGRGWVQLPFFCIAAPLAFVLAVAGVICGIDAGSGSRRRDWRSWLAVAIAIPAAGFAVLLMKWSMEAIASV